MTNLSSPSEILHILKGIVHRSPRNATSRKHRLSLLLCLQCLEQCPVPNKQAITISLLNGQIKLNLIGTDLNKS